jgi:mRNA interferase RelE/StbE
MPRCIKHCGLEQLHPTDRSRKWSAKLCVSPWLMTLMICVMLRSDKLSPVPTLWTSLPIQEKVDAYGLTLKRSASKELQAVSGKETLDRMIKKITELAFNPQPQGSEKFAVRLNIYRFRQGDYRVIYLVDDESRFVNIIKIRRRRNVYR